MKPARQIVYLLSASLLFFNTEILATISIGGYNVYFGDLHNHCNVDDGGHARGTPAEAYSYARTRGGMDFFGLASHDLYITNEEWAAIGAAADAATVDGTFVGFRGFEWTTTPLGHIAIVNSSDYCTSTQTATNSFSKICSWIDARQECVAFLNHPGRQDATHVEFDHFNSTPASNVVGIELWNKTDPFSVYYYNDGYYSNDNNKSFFDEAITRGWQVGAGGGGDDHSGTWGTATSARLAILANNLNRAELLSALKARRFFSTLDKNLALSFTIGGNQMGSTISSADGLMLQVLAYDTDGEIFTEVVVFDRNHNVIATRTPNSTNVNESLTLNTFDGDYFYVKVKQADGDEAISSPIMISGTQVNTPPVCDLTAPTGSENYFAPAQVFVAATASDDGSIAKVTFFANNIQIGEDVNSPYEIYWNSAGAGTYTITAVALDDGGMTTTSAAVDLTIASAQGTFTIEKRIATSSDDAEENIANGAVDATTSSDLELVYDAGLSKNQLVGVRFTGCTIPKNATITSAYIQFTCKETGSNSSSIIIKGETSVSPASFSTTAYSLSSRPKTTSSVAWTIPAWNTTGAATTNERTPDISTLLQEIVNGTSYNPGNAIAFFFSGSGTRCAYSFSGSSAGAALLHVDYCTSPPVNTPPICAITSPADSAMFIGTTDLTITAIATDAAGMVTNVEFLLNDLVVGQDSTAPYSFVVTGLESGSYRLAVRATDDSGAVTTSAPHLITIRDQNLLPTCNITSPGGGSVFTAPASITIEAGAVDGDGSVAKVEFYSNNNKIGEDFSPPFSFSWSNVVAGSYALTAVATDNAGGRATSSAIDIVIMVASPVYRINCGSANAASPFTGDQYVSGGTQRTVTNAITITGITNPAPQTVYQSERYGTCTYTLPNLTAGAQYTVRLHFAELYHTATGKRRFNVVVNGTTVLSNFDIYAIAGARYKAVVQEFPASANASGQIVIKFTTVTDNATIEGIEIIPIIPNIAPTIQSEALATPGLVTGTTTMLSVLGGDDNGESALTYTWAATGTPPAAVTFSINGNNAAKTTTATFTKAGNYTFQVTVKDAGNLTAVSTVQVTVDQKLAAVVISPANASVATSAAQQFTATARDQFATNLIIQPAFSWSVSDGGTVASDGVFTAGTSEGPCAVIVTFGNVSDTASVTVIRVNLAPTIVTAATATPNPVTGTTTTLSVLGNDDNDESNLTYTWTTTGTPPAAVTFSNNGTNVAKTTLVTFAKAGVHTFVATIRDQENLTVTSTVTVTVNQTLTSIVVSPVTASVATSATQQFTATARDQFATNLSTQPAFTWSVSGGGTISSGGLFTAGTTAGGPYSITVSSGSRNAAANVTVTAVESPVYRINCGSTNAASPFTGDQYVSGGTQRTVTNAITITGITNPAPQKVYQSERYGTCTYTLPNLTAGAQYTVRLHFAELYQTATGKRRFNVGINGTTVLSNYDIYAVTGTRYKADLKEFTASANTSGQIIINLTTITDNATISGIEVIRK